MPSVLYRPGPPAPTISDETVALVRQAMAETTRAINTASGLIGYELEAPAKVIVPVITPLVNMLPRRKGSGIDVVHWKAITSFDTARNWGTLADGGTPSSVTYQVAAMQNTLQTISLMNSVSFQAQWRGRSLEADVRARRTAELLYQLKVTEERWLLGASAYLMTPPTPLVSTATTGGSVAAGTYWVQVTAVNAQGETLPSAAAKIVTTGSTSTITVTIFTVPNASYYNVYIGSGASQPANGAMYVQSSISGNANAAQPGIGATVTLSDGVTKMPSGEVQPAYLAVTLTAAVAGSGANPPAASTAKTFVDGSGNILMWDGIIAQALNNQGTGNGLTLGAQVAQPAAANGVLTLSDIDNLLASMYLQAAGDPDYVVMNPLDNIKLTNLVVNAGQLRYVVQAQSGSPDSGDLTAQFRVTRYLNKSTGKEMPIILDRYCPQGHMVFLPLSIPYPVPEISNAIEVETNQEYWGVDFAITDSNFKFADYVDETVKVYFLGGLGVLRGMYPSY